MTTIGTQRSSRTVKRSRLSIKLILIWADEHFALTGKWPTEDCGPVRGHDGESWVAIHHALHDGGRSLPGGVSLANLLEDRRGAPNEASRPRLTVEKITGWVDAYFAKNGKWPNTRSGIIPGSYGLTWKLIDRYLRNGGRGLSGGSALVQLLAKLRPPLTEIKILAWAEAHYRRHGRWPSHHSGRVEVAPGEKWIAINVALRTGARGLPGGTTLSKLLRKSRMMAS